MSALRFEISNPLDLRIASHVISQRTKLCHDRLKVFKLRFFDIVGRCAVSEISFPIFQGFEEQHNIGQCEIIHRWSLSLLELFLMFKCFVPLTWREKDIGVFSCILVDRFATEEALVASGHKGSSDQGW
jgi:hypothetical protein